MHMLNKVMMVMEKKGVEDKKKIKAARHKDNKRLW